MADIQFAIEGIEFTITDAKKWETLTPPEPAKKEDKYAKALDAIEAGEIIQIPTKDTKEMRGYRISFGRKSTARGFRVEYRIEGNILYIRKSEEPIQIKEPKKKKEKVAQEA